MNPILIFCINLPVFLFREKDASIKSSENMENAGWRAAGLQDRPKRNSNES